jgi:UDP-glucose 4-epimerase
LQDYGRTVTTMLDVLEFARLHSPKSMIVYPSSAAVYGTVDRIPITEDFPSHAVSPYGVHKRMAEELCVSYGRHFGIAAATVRFFSVYGEGLRKQLLWEACNKIRRNDLSFFGTGRELRDWVHVDDAASLLFAIARKAASGCPVVNGATGVGVTVREVLKELLAALGAGGEPRFTGAARPGDPDQYVADVGAAQELFSWQHSVPWQSGIRRYADWFRAENP